MQKIFVCDFFSFLSQNLFWYTTDCCALTDSQYSQPWKIFENLRKSIKLILLIILNVKSGEKKLIFKNRIDANIYMNEFLKKKFNFWKKLKNTNQQKTHRSKHAHTFRALETSFIFRSTKFTRSPNSNLINYRVKSREITMEEKYDKKFLENRKFKEVFWGVHPRCPDVQMPRCPDAQMPGCLDVNPLFHFNRPHLRNYWPVWKIPNFYLGDS